jgi:ABC-type uncharacterized transport system permease subunit
MINLIIGVLRAAIRAGSPLLVGTLGEIYTERSGVLNLGVEGVMLMGAVTAFAVTQTTGSIAIGILAAMIAGGLMGLLHGFMSVTLKVNQYVAGLSLVMVGSGVSSLIGLGYIGIRGKTLRPVFLGFDIMVYLFIALALVLWFTLYKTRIGIEIRSVGENPAAADAMGINVNKTRYICTVLGGALIGLAGAYLSTAYLGSWTENMTSGRGWIILALTIFASWDPRGAVLGAWIFGGVEALQYRLQPLGISPSFLGMLPFIATIIILVVSGRLSKGNRGPPEALGKPYRRGER